MVEIYISSFHFLPALKQQAIRSYVFWDGILVRGLFSTGIGILLTVFVVESEVRLGFVIVDRHSKLLAHGLNVLFSPGWIEKHFDILWQTPDMVNSLIDHLWKKIISNVPMSQLLSLPDIV